MRSQTEDHNMLIGLNAGLGRSATLDELVAQIAAAERDGFASVWVSNIFSFDALMVLALAGGRTKTIELGTAIVPTYPRHPSALAQQALTAQAATGNRLALGIGLSHKVVIEGMLGLSYSKPIRHMREYLTVLNGLLTGNPTSFQGEEYRVSAQLNVPGVKAPPVLVAALGAQMLKLAGATSDGSVVWMGGAKYLGDTAVPTITKAAREAGRPAPRIVAGFPVAVTSKTDGARLSASKVFAIYSQLPSYRAVLDIEGAAGAADVALIGSEEEVAAQVKRLADAGVTDFTAALYDVREDPEARERTYRFVARLAKGGG
jgi:5,10-methylenetetrahydromethanopterin reductase